MIPAAGQMEERLLLMLFLCEPAATHSRDDDA
jgi:hypothetical protein